ncbi:class I SAM-dependent methyltransferase [Pseudodesulfovibrio indicus]|uniref:Methyltransferase n=1 Tax=Pseudodesulfovibrio indicus TaxID=1716143 RepID=A0A126QPB6_9BACT|nr:methyltransferase [Pseudodesulfovibrio indicus]AMK11606.1 methyltransferase [Pseudodesulfovibrio indicus]TDT90014.1 lysine methyltransferase [Pseudodesulfovibrio indicus]
MADTVFNLDQPMGTLIDIAVREFGEVGFETVTIGEHSLEVLQVKQMQKYLDKLVDRTRSGKKISLPLWAKVWPSCLILGYTLTRFPFTPGCSVLEVGAGCAVNGMVMARLGLDVTVTDVDPHALLFSRINVLKNGLDGKMAVRRADFTRDNLDSRFDYIIGCEVLYEEAVYEPLVDFLDAHLAQTPTAEILMAMDKKRLGRKFFDKAGDSYAMMKSVANYKDKETGEENVINLFRMKRKGA